MVADGLGQKLGRSPHSIMVLVALRSLRHYPDRHDHRARCQQGRSCHAALVSGVGCAEPDNMHTAAGAVGSIRSRS